MVDLVSCKNEDDPIRKDGNIVLTRKHVHFSKTLGQLTRRSVVELPAEIRSHRYPRYLHE